jgi:hypothetical protein
VARDEQHVRVGAGRFDEPRDAGRDGAVDGRDRRTMAWRSRRGMARAPRIAEVPELVSAAMSLAERAGEEIPALASHDVEEELRLALGGGEETIQQVVVRGARDVVIVARGDRIGAVSCAQLVEQPRRHALRGERGIVEAPLDHLHPVQIERGRRLRDVDDRDAPARRARGRPEGARIDLAGIDPTRERFAGVDLLGMIEEAEVARRASGHQLRPDRSRQGVQRVREIRDPRAAPQGRQLGQGPVRGMAVEDVRVRGIHSDEEDVGRHGGRPRLIGRRYA